MPCLHSLPALQTEARRVAAEALHAAMMDRTLSSDDKRAIQTQHVLMHRRHLFSCPKCWLQPYLCICNGIQRMQAATQLVVHVHHSEWCALCLSASRCGRATTIVVVCRFSSGPWLQRDEMETRRLMSAMLASCVCTMTRPRKFHTNQINDTAGRLQGQGDQLWMRGC